MAEATYTPKTFLKLKKQIEKEYKNQVCGVLKDNWPILELWMRISNLWIYGTMGGIISLNWPAVLAKIQLLEKFQGNITLEQFEGIELIEREVISVLNEKNN